MRALISRDLESREEGISFIQLGHEEETRQSKGSQGRGRQNYFQEAASVARD